MNPIFSLFETLNHVKPSMDGIDPSIWDVLIIEHQKFFNLTTETFRFSNKSSLCWPANISPLLLISEHKTICRSAESTFVWESKHFGSKIEKFLVFNYENVPYNWINAIHWWFIMVKCLEEKKIGCEPLRLWNNYL